RPADHGQQGQYPDPEYTHVILLLVRPSPAEETHHGVRQDDDRESLKKTRKISVVPTEQGGEVGPR
ncbi:MAG TPA: hypothetical protein VHI99_15825, partial [Vicinamibacterales bacterium]|nr:hypothetical protein [Vicinamibacterales bacterium]